MAERSRGFTLLETLVALVIVAIAMGGALRALGVGMRGSEHAGRDLAMAQLATSLIERARLDLRAGRAGGSSGEQDGLAWELVIEERERVGEGPSAARLLLLRARVTAGAGEGLDFSTLALVAEEEP